MESFYEAGKALESLASELRQTLQGFEHKMIEKYRESTPAGKRKLLREIRMEEKNKLRENKEIYREEKKGIIEARKRLEKLLRGK